MLRLINAYTSHTDIHVLWREIEAVMTSYLKSLQTIPITMAQEILESAERDFLVNAGEEGDQVANNRTKGAAVQLIKDEYYALEAFSQKLCLDEPSHQDDCHSSRGRIWKECTCDEIV